MDAVFGIFVEWEVAADVRVIVSVNPSPSSRAAYPRVPNDSWSRRRGKRNKWRTYPDMSPRAESGGIGV